MTYGELAAYVDGRGEAEHEVLRRYAVHASWCLMPWGGVSSGALLGEEIDASACGSPEEFREKARSLRQQNEDDDGNDRDEC